MRIDLMTREYPPEVYGGAGVHAAELTRALRRFAEVRVRAFGNPVAEPHTTGYGVPDSLRDANPALRSLGIDVRIAADARGADLVHSHTWYANAAGHLAALVHGIPHVMTMHSLEPLRPWKAEQLGGGYALSAWLERSAVEAAAGVIAVSSAMRDDICEVYPQVDPGRVHVIHNGIDVENYRPDHGTAALDRLGIDPGRPIVLFVGRVTRQKGLHHLLRAGFELHPEAQLVLCCGQPDTPEIAAEVDALTEELGRARTGVVRVDEMLDPRSLRQLLTHASVFVCPSVYEPMGIVNLEAMACGTAVVASAVGGIPEVVEHGRTGLLVPLERDPRSESGEPADPARFAGALAEAVNTLLEDRDLRARMGREGRRRVETEFTWDHAALKTIEVYKSLTR
ncbi:glycogen synthase [Streptomyces eurythermus]|uniref:glycogen synthase n=1 Tax=Streptomyces eurythermus TaxID=42237 RepID=UPI0034008014